MVHYIQVFKSLEDEGDAPIPARILAIDDDCVTVALHDGIERRYRNHELDRLRAAVELFGADVLVQERWHLLRIPSKDGHFAFSIASEETPWTGCRNKPRAESGRAHLGPRARGCALHQGASSALRSP